MIDFEHFFTQLWQQTQRQYDRSINRDLSQQNWQGLFGRNVRKVLLDTYSGLQDQAEQPLTETHLKTLSSLPEKLMQYALQHNRSSCALSNFPEEHNPDRDYIAEVISHTEHDWQAFVNKISQPGSQV